MAQESGKSILQPVQRSYWPIVQKSFAKYGFSAIDILLNWRAIVGDELANRAYPHRIRWPRADGHLPDSRQARNKKEGGTLIVRVEDGPSAVEIQYLELEIIERINVFYGYSAIARLKVTQGSLGSKPETRRRKQKALTDEQKHQLDSLCDSALSEPLSDALRRLGKNIYSTSK